MNNTEDQQRKLPRHTVSIMHRIKNSDGVILEVDADTLFASNHIDNMIRILRDEYASIDTTLRFFTHFNVESSGHLVGEKMLLPRIITQGYYRTPEDQQLPVLSLENILHGVVVEVREHIPYNELKEADFQYSMKHIRTVDELQKAILKRYSKSMPDQSNENILKSGVGITVLRLEGILNIM